MRASCTYKDVVKETARRTGGSVQETDFVIRAFVATIKHNVYNGYRVPIPQLGVMYPYVYKQAIFNLPNGATIYSAERATPKMYFSKEFKLHLRNNKKVVEVLKNGKKAQRNHRF
ncbi:HU family DNA-binding protein [Candidatus Dojkabacteria bacterium]|jgi:hypothetical protein|nr:HU family DNA-binding protein [Candidatus Dojkabacteria bacterium]